MQSFCFEEANVLSEAEQSIKSLLLPKDIVEKRKNDNCLDIVSSTNRLSLFEKFLSKRYRLKKDMTAEADPAAKECNLSLKTTKQVKHDNTEFKLGSQNSARNTQSVSTSVSHMEMLLGAGIASEFMAGTETLKVICHPIDNERANLIFSYVAIDSAKVNTQAILKKGEWLNIASVKKDLDEKSKTIGIPLTAIKDSNGLNETLYELQYR